MVKGKLKKEQVNDISLDSAYRILKSKGINMISLPGYGNMNLVKNNIIVCIISIYIKIIVLCIIVIIMCCIDYPKHGLFVFSSISSIYINLVFDKFYGKYLFMQFSCSKKYT